MATFKTADQLREAFGNYSQRKDSFSYGAFEALFDMAQDDSGNVTLSVVDIDCTYAEATLFDIVNEHLGRMDYLEWTLEDEDITDADLHELVKNDCQTQMLDWVADRSPIAKANEEKETYIYLYNLV